MHTSADSRAPLNSPSSCIRLWSLLASSTFFPLSIGLLMALLWGFFTYRHVLAFHQRDEWMYSLTGLSEALTAGLFLLCRAPVTVSTEPLESMFALAGAVAPLFLMPSDWCVLPDAGYLIGAGIVLQIFGLLSRNCSFALVAAQRKLKCSGMRKTVRHPLYASYLLILSGYALANTTWTHFLLCCMAVALLLVCLRREEKHLRLDPDCRDYMQQVRFRMIPFLF
jgi:protein-S-isoprenylcysteine O-methyltransferase Ste14